MEKDWVKIFRSTDFYRSEIVRQVLLQHEIDAVLMNKQDSSYHSFGYIEVYIHKEDFDRAIEVLVLNEIDL